jgi:hypothetical protein
MKLMKDKASSLVRVAVQHTDKDHELVRVTRARRIPHGG